MTKEVFVNVPWSRVEPLQRTALVESFILREGTDYGLHEQSHQTKVDSLMAQLNEGKAHLIFDMRSETFNIVSNDAWLTLKRHSDPSV